MIISIISLILVILSFTLTLSVIILKNNEWFGIKQPWLLNFAKYALFQFFLLIALFVYRSLGNLPKNLFDAYVFANVGIIITFYFLRFHMILNAYNNLNIKVYIAFFLVFLVSSIFAFSRMFFRLGFIIDQNPHIVIILEHFGKASIGFFINLGKRISGQMPTSPGSNGIDRNFALGLGTFCATSVAATGAVYMCYEAYQSRQISLRNLKAAEDSAKAAEDSAKAAGVSATAVQQKTDIKAVKHGLMSVEEYNKKYPK